MKINKFELQRVHFMPKELKPGVLYLSEEFGAAAHLCACGCGSKIRTPLGETEWTLEVTAKGPSLHPSIGNWQKPCQSHYWITEGQVEWSTKWTPEQVAFGRRAEEERRRTYYSTLNNKPKGIMQSLWESIKGLFK